MKKAKKWLRRYIPANISATIGAIFAAWLVYKLTKNQILAAYAGTIGDNIGYYGVIAIRDFKKNKAKYIKNGEKYGVIGYLKTVRNLIIEFGTAEALDSLIVRPLCLYWFPIWMPTYELGIIAGKYAADIIFYIPTIISYELRKKYLKD